MRPLLMKACIAALGSVAIAAGAAAPASASARPAKAPKKPSSLNVCAIPSTAQLAEAEIDEPCQEAKTARAPVRKSPLGGSAGSVEYGARWGGETGAPLHSMTILVIHALGSGKALEFFKKKLRLMVLENGLPVSVSKGTASFSGETSSCTNPPTGDCTHGTFLAIAGSWVVEAFLDDYPPTIPGSNEDEASQANDEPEDIAQEEAIKPALASIGASVVAKV